MVNPLLIRKVFGMIGNVISFLLYLSPIPTFKKIWKKSDVEDFSAVPYIATLLNCALWVFYGLPLVTSNNTLVWTINGVGFILESIYIAVFFAFSPKNLRMKILMFLAVEVTFMATIIPYVLVVVHIHEKRALIVGIFALIFNLGMYAAPFSIMKLVLKTKSVKYMPFHLSMMGCLNGLCWSTYALIKFDLFILIPNGLGGLMGLLQLVLYFTFHSKDELEPSKPDGT